jgi:RNA polymerase sigma factor (sigma-70 family)
VIAADPDRSLAQAQDLAPVALALATQGLRELGGVGSHLRPDDWRKPAFAGSADVAQWAGANARRNHVPPSLLRSARSPGPAAQGACAPGSAAVRPAPRAGTEVQRLALPVQQHEPHGLIDPAEMGDDSDPLAEGLDGLQVANALARHDAEAESAGEPLGGLPRVSALDDEALAILIQRIGRQDDRALASLYDATASRVFGLVGRMVNDAALAEEVAEDTYWQVWRQATRFDASRGRPLTWLLAMARSRAIDAIRRRERKAHVALDDDELAAICDEHRPGPHESLAAQRGRQLLVSALAALAPQPRQLVSLAFFRGLTHEEIADCTGLPLGTVKSQIRRALQSLRQSLAEAGCPEMPL